MNRRTFAHKMLELARRMYFEQRGTYKGFGKIASFYRRAWRIEFPNVLGYSSYKEVWNADIMVKLRESVGM